MTPKDRIRELRNESAWSPMPEHLLFLQLEKDKTPTPVTPDGEKTCEECGMKFKSEAMLTYHTVGFCVGPSTEEISPGEISPRTPLPLAAESKAMLDDSTKPRSDLAGRGTMAQATDKQPDKQKESKLEWCTCANGVVPPSAVKIGYDDSDQTFTYICVAQVGDEVIPGSVLPPRGHATVTLNGEEVKATEYSVLADLEGQVSWKRCDTAGAIPRDAVKGGYDSNNLQYFIARGKAPDGNWCCGKYVPHKQQCYFAWEGTEFKTKDFEFLCKKSKQYFSKSDTNMMPSEGTTIAKPKQTTGNVTKLTSEDKTQTSEFTGFSATVNSLQKDEPSNINALSKSDTDIIERDTNKLDSKPDRDSGKGNAKVARQGTGIIEQYKAKIMTPKEMTKSGTEVMTRGKNKTNASKEHISGSGVVTKEGNKVRISKELSKSGTAVLSHDKSKANNSRTNTGIRSNSKNIEF